MCKRSNNVQIRGRRDKQNIHRRVFSGGANDHEAMMERWGEARRRGRGRNKSEEEEEEGKGVGEVRGEEEKGWRCILNSCSCPLDTWHMQ